MTTDTIIDAVETWACSIPLPKPLSFGEFTVATRESSSATRLLNAASGSRTCGRGRVIHGRPPSRPGKISTSGISPSGNSGSRNAKLRWTGPAGPR